jgi:shikimate kinase
MTDDRANIVLIGPRACGKSTLALRLAERLVRPFVDLDDELSRRAGTSVDAAFVALGEAGFRALERAVLADAARLSATVIATGGGAVLGGEAFAALARTGVVVLLDVPAAELLRREAGRSRPPLTGLPPEQELVHVLAERLPLYRAAADIVVPADGPDPILALWQSLPPRIRG